MPTKKAKKTSGFFPGDPASLRFTGDSMSFLGLLLSVFLSLLLVILFLSGGSDRVSGFLGALEDFVFPWLALILLLSIGRELWAIRVHLKHIHLGTIIGEYMGGN